MAPGEKCICQEDEWVNAFGEKNFSVHCGMRLTVSGSVVVASARFFSFEETPEGCYYLSTAFKPLRSLN